MKQYGLIENSERGVWSLTPLGRKTEEVDAEEVRKTVVQQRRSVIQNRANEDILSADVRIQLEIRH